MLPSGKEPMSAFFYKSCHGGHDISSQQQNTDLDSYLVRETQGTPLIFYVTTYTVNGNLSISTIWQPRAASPLQEAWVLHSYD